jgi:hypothetical protein
MFIYHFMETFRLLFAAVLLITVCVEARDITFPSTWNNVHTFLSYDMYIPYEVSDISCIMAFFNPPFYLIMHT